MTGMLVSVACCALGQPLAPPGEEVRHDGHKVVSVLVDDPKIRRAVIGLSEGLWTCGEPGPGFPLKLEMAPDAMAALDDLELPYIVEVENVQALFDAERARLAGQARERPFQKGATRGELPGTFFDDFRTNEQISDYMNALVEAYPDRVSRHPIGQSWEGREIYAMRVNVGATGKPAILVNAQTHAREWITGASGSYVVDQFVRNPSADPRIEQFLADFEFVYVPVLNPDGYAYTWSHSRGWRKNRKPPPEGLSCYGIDNNRNWSVGWDAPSFCGETANGPEPFSELENQAMRDFAWAIPELIAYVDLHSGTEKILSPYSHRLAPPEETAELFDQVNNRIMAAFCRSYDRYVAAGPGLATLLQPAYGSSCDWNYGERGVMSWTWEIYSNFSGGPSSIAPVAQGTMQGLLALGDGARESVLRVRFAGPGLPVRVSTVAETPVVVHVERGARLPDVGATRLWWRLGRSSAFTEAELVAQRDGSLAGHLPPAPCGAVVQYYVEARTTAGALFTSPPAGAAQPYEAGASDAEVYAAFDMETDAGWTGSASGWVNADPNGSAAQAEHAPQGTRCWVTRNQPPGYGLIGDVDGTQRLLSAPIDLAGRSQVTVSYRRWFCTNLIPGGDTATLVVEASPNGSTWHLAESVGTEQRGRGWVEHSFRLDDLFTPSSATHVRVSATDEGGNNIVEAGIDDVVIYRERCPAPCTGDWTRDGTVNSTDVSEFINTWFEDQAQGTFDADFDGNGISNSTDVSEFINAWFGPC